MPRIGLGLGLRHEHPPLKWDPNHLDNMEVDLRGYLRADGDPVDTWINSGAIGNSLDAAAAKRPTKSTLGGVQSVAFDGTDDLAIYSGANADASFLHDGTGATLYIAGSMIAPTLGGFAFDTIGTADWDHIGLSLEWIPGGTGRLRFRIGNGSGAWVILDTSANDDWPKDAPFVMTVRTSTVTFGGNNYQVRLNGAAIINGVFANVASAAAPTYPISVGGDANGGGACVALNCGSIFAFSDLHGSVDVGLTETWLRELYGITFP